jgi:hypothetical protein
MAGISSPRSGAGGAAELDLFGREYVDQTRDFRETHFAVNKKQLTKLMEKETPMSELDIAVDSPLCRIR